MSLRKKIALGFAISASIIAALVAFEYANFIKIKEETRYLELSDTIRSKSLQLRRHEKNYFLYRDLKEIEGVHSYLRDLRDALKSGNGNGKLGSLEKKVEEYGTTFNNIERLSWDIQNELNRLKPLTPKYSAFFPLIEATFLERPGVGAELFVGAFGLKPGDPIIMSLAGLDSEISALRKTGEDILLISKDIDKAARENVEGFIRMSQNAILLTFPLFLLVGVGTLIFIGNDIVKRLRALTDVVEKTGEGRPHAPLLQEFGGGGDEVGLLIRKFGGMEEQLAHRQEEIERKNAEILQGKKLAAIGTLSAGVAHELNNPLNNIHTTAQRLIKKSGEDCPDYMKKGLDDILGQSMRVKRIVGDLIDFARGREPQPRDVELGALVSGAYGLIKNSVETGEVSFSFESEPERITLFADPGQMERVFANLFTNAIQAMGGRGGLRVRAKEKGGSVEITVSDTGPGIPAENIEKIFEPFFTTKERGTGLGLAIAFNIIRKHGGEMAVRSPWDEAGGKGAAFEITLPIRGKEK